MDVLNEKMDSRDSTALWQKFLTAVPYKFNVFYFLIMLFIYEIHRNIFILRSYHIYINIMSHFTPSKVSSINNLFASALMSSNFPGFGSYTFPLTGSGISETVNFVLNYSSYTEDPNGPNAGDGYLGDFDVSAAIRFDFEPTPEPPDNVIPEPSSLLLISSSALALYGFRRRISL